MVFVQMLRALFFVAMALYLQVPWLRSIVYTFHPLIELYCFSGTVFLLVARSETSIQTYLFCNFCLKAEENERRLKSASCFSSHVRKAFLKFYGIGSNESCIGVELRSASAYLASQTFDRDWKFRFRLRCSSF